VAGKPSAKYFCCWFLLKIFTNLPITRVVGSHTNVGTLPLACVGTDSFSWHCRVQINFRQNKGSECHVLSELILDTVLEHERFQSELRRVWIVYSLTELRLVVESNHCPRENHVEGGLLVVRKKYMSWRLI
jgi:hypothetical protein